MTKYYCEVELFRQENVGNEEYTTFYKIFSKKKKDVDTIATVNAIIGDEDLRYNTEITGFFIKMKKVNPNKKGFKKLTIGGNWTNKSVYKK